MTTLNELCYSVRESYKLYSDDGDISNEYIKFLIKNTRAMLLAQKYYVRGNLIPNKIRQHFNKELEVAEENDFVSGIGTVLRTKYPIVAPFEGFNLKSNIRLNSGSYSDINFTFIDYSRVPFVGRNKWNQNTIYVWLGNDNRLYFISSNPAVMLLENIRVSMVVEDPEAAYPETAYYDSNTEFDYTVYPLEEEMVSQLTDIIVKKLAQNISASEDKHNDDNDSNQPAQ